MAFHTIILLNAGLSLQTAFTDSAVSSSMLAGVSLMVTISLHYYTPQKNRYGYLLSLCTSLSVLWLFSSRFILLMQGHGAAYENLFEQTLLIRGATGFLVTICMALIATLWYTLQEQQESDSRKREAEKLSRDAELNNLRQQLQPHFLFNSLNSINALIGSQPTQARTMIQQLSDFLRGTLKKDQRQWIQLQEELDHLQLYLAIEKVRFGHRLHTTIANEAEGTKLPLMLLQPVVENAIKFGLYNTLDAVTIRIEARVEKGYLVLQVTNPYDPQSAMLQNGTGFGLRSVQRRLYLLFGSNDLLRTTASENIFTTVIKIPQP
jgi:LytS/YehU family sensor histidine kinase